MNTKKLTVYILAVMGMIFTTIISYNVYQNETLVIHEKFKIEVNNQIELLNQEVLLNLEVLRGLKNLFKSSDFVTPEEFSTATKETLNIYKSIKALEWIPSVPHEKREEFEDARKKYFPNFQITQKETNGIMKKASNKKFYFPVYYVEPYIGNEPALGFDLSSNETRLSTLLESRNTGKTLASDSINLVQDNSRAFLVFSPVYDLTSITKEQRIKNLKGFVLGVFRINDILSGALKYKYSNDIVLNLLYKNNYKPFFSNDESISTDEFTYIKAFRTIPGQELIVQAKPKEGYIKSKRGHSPLVVFIMGTVFIVIGASYTFSVINYSSQMEKEVENRTKELKNLNVILEDLSQKDALTGLYNRRFFDEVLEKEFKLSLRNRTSLSILMIDIDYFKNYNDTYGHIQGDECLKLVSSCINNTFLRPTDFVARYGGEEFIVILPNTMDIEYLCRKLIKEVRLLNLEHNNSKTDKIVTISIGAYSHPITEESDKLTLVEMADKALYEAKQNGRNRYVIY